MRMDTVVSFVIGAIIPLSVPSSSTLRDRVLPRVVVLDP